MNLNLSRINLSQIKRIHFKSLAHCIAASLISQYYILLTSKQVHATSYGIKYKMEDCTQQYCSPYLWGGELIRYIDFNLDNVAKESREHPG
jgi:hypothetical protein